MRDKGLWKEDERGFPHILVRCSRRIVGFCKVGGDGWVVRRFEPVRQFWGVVIDVEKVVWKSQMLLWKMAENEEEFQKKA